MNKIVFEKISELLRINKKTVIAIDGMCASGKTTLANEIKEHFGGTVISADSFFLPFDMRTHQRLSEPGGNFHRERFKEEIISNLSKDRLSYGVFDCATGEITDRKEIEENRLLIIEGSYCMHPELKAEYDLKIFTQTNEKTQLSRIEKRNGSAALEAFKNKWIPLENKYFSFFHINEKCDIVYVSPEHCLRC